MPIIELHHTWIGEHVIILHFSFIFGKNMLNTICVDSKIGFFFWNLFESYILNKRVNTEFVLLVVEEDLNKPLLLFLMVMFEN